MRKTLILLYSSIFITIISCSENKPIKKTSPIVVSGNLLERLISTDKLKIEISESGCEYLRSELIFIYKENDFYCFELDTVIYKYPIRLENKILNIYSVFEKSLRQELSNDIVCTSTNNIKVTSKSDTIELVDKSCSYKGYDIFKEKILALK